MRRLSRRSHLERVLYEAERWLISRKTNESPLQKLPRRVIDVFTSTDSSIVNLKEIDTSLKGSKGHYICLSHRWSQLSRPFTTTVDSLEDRIQGIRLQDLSVTFQDVITIARRLKIQYVWIDSLCILQNSRGDWEQESSKMGQYYKSSWLTIGAGMNGDGLFLEREALSMPYFKLNNASSTSSLYFLQRPHSRPAQETLLQNQSPLYSRGWTLQEEILSSRFLSFEPTQVYFRCSKYIDYECGHREIVTRWNTLTAQFDPQDVNTKALWIRIVENYSRRALKVTTDKLPALSGLAQEYQRAFGDNYLAGLWKSDLWIHLLWYGNVAQRPMEYLGPSWSWVSCNSIVAFAGYRFSECCMALRDASTDIIGENPLGRVSGGYIVIEAPIAVFIVEKAPKEDQDPSKHNVKLFTDNGQPCTYYPDELPPEDHMSITFVYIANTMGLTLLPIPGMTQTFRRVGFAFTPSLPARSPSSRIKIF